EPTLAADLAAFAVLNPKFRELKVLTKLVAEHGEEFPALAEQWALLLPSLEQSAVNGVLPPDRDPVVRTLFRQLLLAHPEPPKGRFARPQSRASASNKAPPAKPLRVAKPSSSFWEKELSLGRKPKPAPAPPQSKPKPKAQRPA